MHGLYQNEREHELEGAFFSTDDEANLVIPTQAMHLG